PRDEPVREIRGQIRELVRSNYGEREISEIAVEFVQVALCPAPNVREEQLLTVFQSQPACELQLAVPGPAIAAQHQRVSILYNARLNRNHALRVVLKPARPNTQHAGQRMFDLYVPGGTVGREIATHGPSEEERRVLSVRTLGDIHEQARPVNDRPVGCERSHHHLRITPECIHVQRDSIIEQAPAASDCCLLVVEWHPRKTNAGSYSERLGYTLIFETCADVQRQPLAQNPVILPEEVRLKIVEIERLASNEVDSFQSHARVVLNQRSSSVERATVVCPRKSGAELQIV